MDKVLICFLYLLFFMCAQVRMLAEEQAVQSAPYA